MSTTTGMAVPPAQGPALSKRSESIAATRTNTPKSTFVTINKADPHFEVEKAKAKLDLALKEVEIYNQAQTLEEKLRDLENLEMEVDEVGQGLVNSLVVAKKAFEALENKLRNAEGNKQNFVLAVQFDNGDKDKVNLRRAELEIMKLKATMVEKEIEIMEDEMNFKDHVRDKQTTDTRMADAQHAVDAARNQLDDLKEALGAAEVEFGDKYGTSLGGFADAVASQAQLTAEVQALKAKVEQMGPLYWIGHATRARYILWELKYLRGTPMDREIELESHTAWKMAKIVADATMYLEFCDRQRLPTEDFEFLYGVTAAFAWEHRDFSMLMNMLGWKQDMRRMRSSCKPEVFNENYEKVIAKIMPNFELKCDEDLKSDASAFESYLVMQSEHEKARLNHGSAPRIGQSSRPNYGSGVNNSSSSFAYASQMGINWFPMGFSLI